MSKQNKIIIPYKPHSGQLEIHKDKHRFRTMVCGRRFGKTVFAVNELIKKALINPGNYWYVAPYYGQAKDIAWQIFKKYAVDEIVIKWNESELTLQLINGSIIKLKGADKPDSLRGVGLHGVILDEFADIKTNVWDLVVRPMLSDYQGWALFLGTPKGKLNNLYEMFIKDVNKEDKEYRTFEGLPVNAHSDYISYSFKTSDNPHISQEEIDTAKEELATAYFLQEYEASFENYTGIIYKEFDKNKHVLEPIKLEPWWNIYVGIDTGRTSCVSFVAKDGEGNEYVFDEVYDYDGTVKEICDKIRYVLNRWRINENKVDFVIDSASQVKREYRENNVYCKDSNKDVENQIAQIRNRFASNSLFMFNTCKMHIIEHQGYVWDDKSKNPQPVKKNDHSCNSLQYIFSTYITSNSIDKEALKEKQNSLMYRAQHEYKNKRKLGYS